VNNFEAQLKELLNENCKENESDTPDFILAQYMNNCLKAFNDAVLQRRKWHSNENTEDWESK